MTYRITGLDPAPYQALAGHDDAALAAVLARRVTATADAGYPCRLTLEDARAGDSLLLVNHASHDVATPYRSDYAIYVREGAVRPASYVDEPPPVFATRALSLRAFAAAGMIVRATLVQPGEADAAIRDLFSDTGVAYILAYNAVYGCFSARIDRDGDQA